MATYVALVRGINVGGRTVPMERLRDVFAAVGHTNVRSYIQSGNVVFDGLDRNAGRVAAELERACSDAFGFDVTVILRTGREIAAIVEAHVFDGNDRSRRFLYVTFLAERPGVAKARALDASQYAPDEFVVAGREVFVYCPNGYGRTKINNTFFERALGVAATTRNWNTVMKLRDLTGGD